MCAQHVNPVRVIVGERLVFVFIAAQNSSKV